MTQLDRAAQTVRPRSPLPLILGLIAVAIGVVVVFASGRRSEVPEPAGPLPAPLADDSIAEGDIPVTPARDTQPAVPASGDPVPRDPIPPATPRDTAARVPRDTDSVRPPIGDPAALPRPPVTLPRPEPDSAGDRP